METNKLKKTLTKTNNIKRKRLPEKAKQFSLVDKVE